MVCQAEAAEAQRDECTGINKLQATSGQLPGSNLGSWLLNDLERCHMEPLILHTPATLGDMGVCLHCRFIANIAQTPAETPSQHGSVCPHFYRVIPHFPSACAELPAWARPVLSGASLVRDSLLGSEHSCLDIHLWGCDRDIEMCKELDLWFRLWVCPLWPPCRHPTVAPIGWHGKCVMAVVGEEGRRDDVMREGHEQVTAAVTVPNYVFFFSSTGGFFPASSSLPLSDKSPLPPVLTPSVYYWYRSCKHTGTQSIFLSHSVPVYI